VILAMAIGIGALFGSGAFLLMKRDLIRVVGGVILISNAINLFIIAAGLSRGLEPIYPIEPGSHVSDPLVQALVLTAIVITFGTTAVLLGLIYRIYHGARPVDPVSSASRAESGVDDPEAG
jgi:multicomponent Na+:H+ antiporter subunit C